MADMVTKGLMMNMEGCCCRFCMGHSVAMDEHRQLLAGHIWAGWGTMLAVVVAVGVVWLLLA